MECICNRQGLVVVHVRPIKYSSNLNGSVANWNGWPSGELGLLPQRVGAHDAHSQQFAVPG